LTSRSLVLLSGEGTTVPAAEAKALFLAYDHSSQFEAPEPRVLLADSKADPSVVGARIAFARRVGVLVQDQVEAAPILKGRRVRFRCFDLVPKGGQPDPGKYLARIDSTIDLLNPDYELTLVRGERDYIAVTEPGGMRQGWSSRRPRSRPFFHPSAIFPKLSRALFNLTRCKVGEVFLEPFAGTGSIAIEASIVGARVAAVDLSGLMARGALSNMKHYSQDWLGVIRADSAHLPLSRVDAVATDIPYGRASSTRGRSPRDMLELLLPAFADVTRPGSRVVLMHPQELSVQRSRDFESEEEHHLHVHKLLTRTITILRRS
jgi:16S rRNA G966 N2-methylase RsmD